LKHETPTFRDQGQKVRDGTGRWCGAHTGSTLRQVEKKDAAPRVRLAIRRQVQTLLTLVVNSSLGTIWGSEFDVRVLLIEDNDAYFLSRPRRGKMVVEEFLGAFFLFSLYFF
jgi:hypothetical protein